MLALWGFVNYETNEGCAWICQRTARFTLGIAFLLCNGVGRWRGENKDVFGSHHP
jgi:hypothetical protein